MKVPVPPPAALEVLLARLAKNGRLTEVLVSPSTAADTDYDPWEWFFRHDPPAGLTREEWWVAVRLRRTQAARPTPFTMKDGTRLTYKLPEPIANAATRDRYLVRSLIEEAMTSSQLEGASTSRGRAKQMLREDRAPRDRSEQMILNNYSAMQRVIELRDERLTPELVCEIHRIVTDGTLDDPADAGRLQRPGELRVRIYGTQTEEQVLHVPPPAETLPERLETLCGFANDVDRSDGTVPYMPPLLRALTLHFMMGYDHYFSDGNGRTSRAVFYWSMLRQGFFLTEFLSISRLLRKAPARYARGFLLTGQDEGDLTHFFLAQARVVVQAIDELDAYLARKTGQLREATRLLRNLGLNHRQVALVETFLRDPSGSVTVEAHRTTHGVVPQTARTDLQDLEHRGLLTSAKQGRKVMWFPARDLAQRVGA